MSALERTCGGLAWAAMTAVVLLLSGVSCHTTRPCRKGTIFVTVNFGGYAAADHLIVAVAVANAPLRMSKALPLSGKPSDTVEISFPAGYPASTDAVTVVATLYPKTGAMLATKTSLTTLDPGCTSLQIDFGGGTADGSVDSGAGSGGSAGGGGGSAGGGGTGIGTGGAAGIVGTTGGASGSGGGSAGSGGVATGGRAGTGGGAGSVGSGGGGGAAGAGSGGRASTGGAAGATDGGVDRTCMPTGAETCYNNLDDDCNGLIDCADTAACNPVAQCQPLDPAMGVIGAAVPATAACPVGAPTARNIMTGLTASGCTGCSCAAGTATLTCRADIYGYYTAGAPECTANTGGQLVTTLNSTQGCFTPNWSGGLFVTGARASAFTGTPSGTCLPGGTPTRGTPVWSTTNKFCSVPTTGGGCAAGFACVPRTVVAAGACLLLDGNRTCPIGTPRVSSWFSGFTDTRTCGTCTCGAPTGGTCTSMIIAVGNDYSCSDAALHGYLRSGDRLCIAGTGAYSPGLQFSGAPVPPTCAASAGFSGTLAATGPTVLCCL
ncbi:MAG: hypothetical protein ABUR63_02670 [Verrucomicrobiota bacterium]